MCKNALYVLHYYELKKIIFEKIMTKDKNSKSLVIFRQQGVCISDEGGDDVCRK